MPVSVGPESPTESNLGAPVGGISYWWRVIGDWIKSMSPAGVTQYDTDWVTVPLAAGFQASNGTPSVRRVGKQIIWRGSVQPNPAGTFAASSVINITAANGVPTGYRPLEALNRMASAGSAHQAARVSVTAGGQLSIITGATPGTYYDLSALSGYMVD